MKKTTLAILAILAVGTPCLAALTFGAKGTFLSSSIDNWMLSIPFFVAGLVGLAFARRV